MRKAYYSEMYGSDNTLAVAWRQDAATGTTDFAVVNLVAGKVLLRQSRPHPVKPGVWAAGLVYLENYPLPGKYSLLKPDGEFLLENCDYITLIDNQVCYIKDDRFQTLLVAEPDLSRTPTVFRQSIEGTEIQQLSLYGQSAIVDRENKLVIPFQRDRSYRVCPEARLIFGVQSHGDGPSDFVVYDMNGSQLSQFTADFESFDLVGTKLLRTYSDENFGLFDLLQSREIIPATYQEMEIFEKQGLIRVLTDDGKYGYFDFTGRRYFTD